MANLITVESFSDPLEAHLAKGRLEAEGIQAFITNEHHIWANWMISHALGGVRVQVNSKNIDAAKRVMEQYINGAYEKELNQEFNDLNVKLCPSCHSEAYTNSPTRLSKVLLIISFGLLGIISKLKKVNHKCNECGFSWKD